MRLLELYESLLHVIGLRHVESLVHDVIRGLVSRGCAVAAITARWSRLADRTVAQLKKVDIDFAGLAPFEDWQISDCACVKSGIIFCNGANKAKLFKMVCEYNAFSAERVIVVDDRYKHLENFSELFIEDEIDHLLFHYTGAGRFVSSYDNSQALLELATLMVQHPEIQTAAERFFFCKDA